MKNKNSEIEKENNSKNTDATNTNEINLAIDSTRQKQEKAKLEQAAKEQHQIEYQSYTQGLKNTCNVIHRIIDGAFKILYTTDRNATSYTLIDNTSSAVIQYVESSQKKDTATPDQDQDQDNDIILDYINKNIQNSLLWMLFFDFDTPLELLEGKDRETANNTVKYHIQRIATHVLCYLFKHFSVHQIISTDYRGCYAPEELEKLMQQTDANGVALYFKVVSKYFVDHETHKIIDGDLLRHTRTNNGLSLLKWQRESNDVFIDELTEEPLLLHLVKTNKDGELEKTEGKKPQSKIFNPEFCQIFRRYRNGCRSVPYNPFVKDRLYFDKYNGLDYFNIYRPPFYKWRKIPAKYIQPVQDMFEQYQEIVQAVCNYRQDQIDYIHDYATHLVRRPFEGVEYLTVLVSETRGLGKGAVTETFRRLAGTDNYTSIQRNFKNIIGDYNMCLGSTVFQTHEELGDLGCLELPPNIQTLKEKTTARTAFLRDPFVKGFEGIIFPRIFCNTNNISECIPEQGERRQAFILGCNNTARIDEFKARAGDYRHKLDTELGSYFIEYLYQYYSKRDYSRTQKTENGTERELDFAHAYPCYFCFTVNNKMLKAKTICTKADVVAKALYDIAIELKDIEDRSQAALGSSLISNSQYAGELQNIVDFVNIGNQTPITAYNIIHKLISVNYKISDPPIQIIICYIKNTLEQLHSASDELSSFYDGRRAVTHLNKYGKMLSAFAEKYPKILEKTEDKKKGNTYKLNPNFKDLIIDLVTEQELND